MSEAVKEQITIADFEQMDAPARIAAIGRVHGADAFVLSSMQKTAGVIMHMIHRASAPIRVVFVDTQFHFPETLEIRDEFARRYDLDIVTVRPKLSPEQQREKYGCELYNYVDGQPNCCNMRKEEPFLEAARGYKAYMNGLMRAEGGRRAATPGISHDPRIGLVTYHPIFDWTHSMVEEYTREHDLPVHALYAKGYPSIGCAPCTTPVAPGEDRRAGRWRHLRQADGHQPAYCNINHGDGGGI